MSAIARRLGPDGWIPMIFLGGFLLVVLVNGVMIWLAVDTFTGIATERHYEKGLAYNQALEAAEAQAALGWRAETGFESSGPGAGRLQLMLRDSVRRAVAGARVTALFQRPSSPEADRTAALAEIAPGRYAASIDLGAPGNWAVRLEAHLGGARYQVSRRLTVE
jgi:nitrogen fixation protein FixH